MRRARVCWQTSEQRDWNQNALRSSESARFSHPGAGTKEGAAVRGLTAISRCGQGARASPQAVGLDDARIARRRARGRGRRSLINDGVDLVAGTREDVAQLAQPLGVLQCAVRAVAKQSAREHLQL